GSAKRERAEQKVCRIEQLPQLIKAHACRWFLKATACPVNQPMCDVTMSDSLYPLRDRVDKRVEPSLAQRLFQQLAIFLAQPRPLHDPRAECGEGMHVCSSVVHQRVQNEHGRIKEVFDDQPPKFHSAGAVKHVEGKPPKPLQRRDSAVYTDEPIPQ